MPNEPKGATTAEGWSTILDTQAQHRDTMEPDPCQQWIASLDGLSGDPLRRAAQIALAAVDRVLSSDSIVTDEEATALSAAHDELHAALS